MFICYASTIEDQFELPTRRWAHSPVQPNFRGHDPIIGQRDERDARTRFIDFPTAAGLRRIKLSEEWVIPTAVAISFHHRLRQSRECWELNEIHRTDSKPWGVLPDVFTI